MTEYDTIPCPTCKGEGGHVVAIVCGYACDYCGGCTESETCSACDGECEVTAESDCCGHEMVNGICLGCLQEEEAA